MNGTVLYPLLPTIVLMAQSILQPAFFLSHGGGPCFFMDAGGQPPLCYMDKHSTIAQWYRDFQKQFVPHKPAALVVFSAHWEEKSTVHITAKPNPGLYFDYYGFPDHTYKLQYPAPGDSKLAERISGLLESTGIKTTLDNERDWDHGVFVPLLLMFPNADIPIVQVSLLSSLDPEKHIQIGAALAPLRKENILFIGSGFATHNLSAIWKTSNNPSVAPWMNWLTDTITGTNYNHEEKKQKLINWTSAPGARFAHPREEHLIPLHMVFGATSGSATQILDFVDYTSAMSFANYKFE